MTGVLVSAHNLRKTYRRGHETVEALRGVTFDIAPGEFVTVMGPSGCGKSTLLHLLGGIDRPTSGRLLVDGQDLTTLDEEGLTRYRRAQVGFVFQFYNLLPTLSALGNVELPLIALGISRRQRRAMARDVLELVGLGDRLDHKPGELSGGQQQRVAIARAIVAAQRSAVGKRHLLLADEPTGDLDSQSAQQVVEILRRLNRELGVTIVLVTHDPMVGGAGSRRITLKDGLIVADERNGQISKSANQQVANRQIGNEGYLPI